MASLMWFGCALVCQADTNSMFPTCMSSMWRLMIGSGWCGDRVGSAGGGLPGCGVVAVGHGRRVRILHDAPCFGRVTRLRWLVRIWRCGEPRVRAGTFA